MKKLSSVLMRLAQVELAVGVILLVVLFVTGQFHSPSFFFILGFGAIQSSFYTYIIGIMLACIMETQPETE